MTICTVYFSHSGNNYKYQANKEIIHKFYMFKQDRNMPNAIYFEKYNNLLEVLRNQGIDIGCEPGTLKHKLNNLEPPVNEIIDTSEDELNEVKVYTRAIYIDIAFLVMSDHSRYGKFLEDLESQQTQGYSDFFPTNIVEAYCILTH